MSSINERTRKAEIKAQIKDKQNLLIDLHTHKLNYIHKHPVETKYTSRTIQEIDWQISYNRSRIDALLESL